MQASPAPAGGGSNGGKAEASAAGAGTPGDSAGTEGAVGSALAERYPGDIGLSEDPAVLFFDDFEQGWGRWDAPAADTEYMHLEGDPGLAYAGEHYLRSAVTSAHLRQREYISSQSSIAFPEPAQEIYLRYYARFVGTAPTPHHWVRMTAGAEGYNGSGRANTVPGGEEGFWFDFDANTRDVFNFYVYWYKMRSGRCNNGSTTPGCAGDQGSTYHYGNVFRPPNQQAFQRDQWLCIEVHARANDVGGQNGSLSFWLDDKLIGDYGPGHPDGTWLRDTFHAGGCDFSACAEPEPFGGFDFRSSEEVLFRGFVLDNYYERGSSEKRRQTLAEMGVAVDDPQTILFDNVVVARERIGCVRSQSAR